MTSRTITLTIERTIPLAKQITPTNKDVIPTTKKMIPAIQKMIRLSSAIQGVLRLFQPRGRVNFHTLVLLKRAAARPAATPELHAH